jgi:hypothetical protein
MITAITAFLKGPVFVFCFVFAVLGVARLAFMHVHLIATAFYNTWHHEYNRRDLANVVLKRAFILEPRQFGFREGPLAWVLADAAMTVLLLPCVPHIVLAEKFFGVTLPAVSPSLTGVLILLIGISISIRLFLLSRTSRESLGTPNTVVLWSSLLLLIVSGYGANAINSPGMLQLVRIFHVLLGDALIFLIPLTRVGYWLVSPLANITSHLGVWLLPDAPRRDETSAYFKRLSEKR